MKVTNKELLDAQQGIEELSKVELPIKTAYWVSRLKDRINSGLKPFNKQRNEIIKQYMDKNGNVPQESREEVSEQIENILHVEFEIDNIKTIDLSEVDVSIKPNALFGLDRFVKI